MRMPEARGSGSLGFRSLGFRSRGFRAGVQEFRAKGSEVEFRVDGLWLRERRFRVQGLRNFGSRRLVLSWL